VNVGREQHGHPGTYVISKESDAGKQARLRLWSVLGNATDVIGEVFQKKIKSTVCGSDTNANWAATVRLDVRMEGDPRQALD
jgi:hypothetical protein